jgi:class 3 adenylate cyclase
MSEGRVERRLTAVLAVDVAGYSRLMGADEEGTLAALRAVRRELGDPKIAEHPGRIVETSAMGCSRLNMGDYAVVWFDTTATRPMRGSCRPLRR